MSCYELYKDMKALVGLRKDETAVETFVILHLYFKTHLRQRQIADYVGMTQQGISLIVNGERRAAIRNLYVRLMTNMAIGLVLDWLLERKARKSYGIGG